MAVKVMLAPGIAQAVVRSQRTKQRTEARPRRRRSSVFDADGNEVFITLLCLKCHNVRPLSQFGLRRMADGAIRNQPWCRSCRAGASAENPKRRRSRSTEQCPEQSQPTGAGDAARAGTIIDPGTLAAQVVAALNGGRR